MKNKFQLCITGHLQIHMSLIWLFSILLLNSCMECLNNNNNNISVEKNPDPIPPKKINQVDEVILFLGNPGVGKSALFNSIFQQVVFNSGANSRKVLTAKKQEHIHENRLYIDTPGLDNLEMSEQAAKEIEVALKQNNNYKIIFVATLDAGRLNYHDFIAINRICAAIKVPFEYGLIFNKVTKRIISKLKGEMLNKCLKLLNNPPVSTLFLEKDDEMEDADNVYFRDNSENMKKLRTFISNLGTTKLLPTDIGKISIGNFQEEIKNMKDTLKGLN